MNELTTIRKLLELGDRQGAMRMLAGVIQQDRSNLEAWLLLAQAVQEGQKKADCYRQVLRLDPGNPLAIQGMALLRTARMTGVMPPTTHLPSTPSDTPNPLAQETSAVAIPDELKPIPEITPSQLLPESVEEESIQLDGDISFPDLDLPSEQISPQAEPEWIRSEPPNDLLQEPEAEEWDDEIPELPDAIFQPSNSLPGALPRYGQVDSTQPPPQTLPIVQPLPSPSNEETPDNFHPAELFAQSSAEASPGLEGKPTKNRLPLALRLLISLIILGALGGAIFYGATLLISALPTPTPLPLPPAEPVATITLRASWTPLPTNTPYPTLTPIPTNTPFGGGGPSGLLIAYAANDVLSIWQDGYSSSLAAVDNTISQIAISSNQQIIAFIRDNSLWVANRNNDPLSLLVSPSTFPNQYLPQGTTRMLVRSFAWLPDSTQLLFNTTLETLTDTSQPAHDLWLVNIESGLVERLLETEMGGNIYPAPDGSHIALVTSTTVSLISPDGTDRRVMLTFDQIISESGQVFYPVPVWSPDSSRLVVVIPPRDSQSNPTDPSILWNVSVSEPTAQQLGEFLTMGGPVMISPNLNRVLYVLLNVTESPAGELHLANADGSNDTILLDGMSVQLLGWTTESSGYVYIQDSDTMAYYNNVDSPEEVLLLTVPIEMQPFLHFYWISPDAAVVRTGASWPSDLYIVQRGLSEITLVQNEDSPILVDYEIVTTGD